MRWEWWGGGALRSPLAFDTETRLIRDGLDVPDLALLVASDGESVAVVHPDDASEFLRVHRRHRWYGYNAAFDFWVLDRHTKGSRTLWDAAGEGRLVCLRLLRRLIRLARSGVPDRSGTLADACRECGLPSPDKEDPYRLRYGELVGLSRAEIEAHPEAEGFLSYAVADALSTHRLIAPLEAEASSLQKRHGRAVHPGAAGRWGHLSVAIQTRADIVLDHLSRVPLLVDSESVERAESGARLLLDRLADSLEAQCPGLWHTYARQKGSLWGDQAPARKYGPNGLPRRCEAALVARLVEVAAEQGKEPVRTERGEVSTSAKEWLRHCPCPFTEEWCRYEALKKRLTTMIVPLKGGRIYASYETLLRTGRTSASKHRDLPSVPIQQVPRDNEFRRLFLADPGTLRLTIDYSYLELRTLAACCVARYGRSKLAEAIRDHTRAVREGRSDVPDPHELTASQILGIAPAAFLRLPKEQRKEARQKAKAANFGFPGGLGVARFIDYAEANYGVRLTRDEAKRIKQLWVDTYPEMEFWLSDSTEENLSASLCCPAKDLRAWFGRSLWHLRHAVEGALDEDRARPYFEKLLRVCRDREVAEALRSFDYSPAAHERLADRLLTGHASTPTGRLRGKVGYCDGANTPFQGLAADGAKEALWRLLHSGYRVKAFVHDEILVDLPEDQAERLRPRVHQILDSAMESVMLGDIPCASESHLGKTWTKG